METIKIIHQEDDKINIVNKDGLGILLDDEKSLEAWLDSDEPDAKWVEELKEIAKAAHVVNPKLRGIEKVDVEITRKSITLI